MSDSGTRPFITDDFLLSTPESVALYHEYAENEPIIDYHSHLSPAMIAADATFENMTKAWLDGDHYKWRQMRANGVEERYCTGAAPDADKFRAWARTVPATLRNPLYHWTHLELKRYFGIDRLLCPETAEAVWTECNRRLQSGSMSVRGLLESMRVRVLCTTDDPTDDLAAHRAIAADASFGVRVLPTFRPDRAMAVESPETYREWISALESRGGFTITTWDNLIHALRRRHDHFHATGCRVSDHGIERLHCCEYTESNLRSMFTRVRSGQHLTAEETAAFKTALLEQFGEMDHEKNWAMQLHIGALRNNNSRLFRRLGPDTGFDTMADGELARPLAQLLDRLDSRHRLPRTILYHLNPRENELLVALAGCFQDGATPGKVQFGSAWWFMDQKSGIERQIDALSSLGLLSRFIGMLTDSRSFLSFTRHEYFRRVLCDIVGRDMHRGLVPHDMKLAGGMVRDICFTNAQRYFDFPGL